MSRRPLKYMLMPEDGRALWEAHRDGWEVKVRFHRFSHRVNGVEFHSMLGSSQTGAKLGVATCRVCGKKIEAAAPRFMLLGDPGDNTWTTQKWYVHAEPCV